MDSLWNAPFRTIYCYLWSYFILISFLDDWNKFNSYSICSLKNRFNGAIYKLSYPVYTRVKSRLVWIPAPDSLVGTAPDKKFRVPRFKSQSAPSLFHPSCYTCIYSIAIEFIPMINSTSLKLTNVHDLVLLFLLHCLWLYVSDI